MAERQKKDLARGLLGKSVQRSMRDFKMSSARRKWNLNGTIEMPKKKIWTPKRKNYGLTSRLSVGRFYCNPLTARCNFRAEAVAIARHDCGSRRHLGPTGS